MNSWLSLILFDFWSPLGSLKVVRCSPISVEILDQSKGMQQGDDKGDILSLQHRMEIPKVENINEKEFSEVGIVT